MQVTDITIKDIPSIEQVEGMLRLVVEHLCGAGHHKTSLSEKEKKKIEAIIEVAKKRKLTHAHLNKLLSIIDEEKVSKPFFSFFFQKSAISLNEFIKGIEKYKLYAILRFGSFANAYKYLSKLNKKDLTKALGNYALDKSYLLRKFRKRKSIPKSIEIQYIKGTQTWLTGYVTQREFNNQYTKLKNLISKQSGDRIEILQKYGECSNFYTKTEEVLKKVDDVAQQNSKKYLKYPYIDVYVATSMRNKWEYEEADEFIEKLRKHKDLKGINLGFFNPTQSKWINRYDKGLMEGLMLRRSQCTIYMVQETDTFGKDSELAATLAQGKPVIAYVPTINPISRANRIQEYPVDFFINRIYIHQAENTFESEDFLRRIKKEFNINNPTKLLKDFQKQAIRYRKDQPFAYCNSKDREFKNAYPDFENICRAIATAEYLFMEKRAFILRKLHPLSMQIDQRNGVANGVLVVRSPRDCGKLLYQILTNTMGFTIKEVEGGAILEENISKSPFRVITSNVILTNAFWRSYLMNELYYVSR